SGRSMFSRIDGKSCCLTLFAARDIHLITEIPCPVASFHCPLTVAAQSFHPPLIATAVAKLLRNTPAMQMFLPENANFNLILVLTD
ncbi:MAG: hypothetical protein J1F43_05245, partial [Muribaculaceae bacterium]|nr:hypothetical protein [Muribaculaceae bacterium]